MAAIRVLQKDGFRKFELIGKDEPDGATNDYRAWRGETPAYIEVNNLHANATVFDIFAREIGLVYAREPWNYAFHLAIDYAYDWIFSG